VINAVVIFEVGAADVNAFAVVADGATAVSDCAVVEGGASVNGDPDAGKCCCFIAVDMSASMSFASGGVAAVIAFYVLVGGAADVNVSVSCRWWSCG
jgi:hypothetical protein